MHRLILLASLAAGCIKAPDVILVDSKTILERQAAGSFHGLEEELTQAALSPRPAPLVGSQLGPASHPLVAEEADSEGARLDALLLRGCIGEALDGTLVETAATCTGTIEVTQRSRLVERANRNRWQV